MKTFLSFTQAAIGLHVTFFAERTGDLAFTLKITGYRLK